MFKITNSSGKSYVQYKAVDDTGFKVVPSWFKNGEFKRDINFIERRLAYGVSWSKSCDGYELKICSMPKRRISVRKIDGKYSAIATINGVDCILEQVHVRLKGKLKIDSIEISGKALSDASSVCEKVNK